MLLKHKSDPIPSSLQHLQYVTFQSQLFISASRDSPHSLSPPALLALDPFCSSNTSSCSYPGRGMLFPRLVGGCFLSSSGSHRPPEKEKPSLTCLLHETLLRTLTPPCASKEYSPASKEEPVSTGNLSNWFITVPAQMDSQ